MSRTNRQRMNRTLWAGLIILLSSFLQAAPAQTFDDPALADPLSPINKLHEGLIKMMQLPGFVARNAQLRPIVNDTFDAATIARIALGRNWRKLSDEEQTTLSKLMAEVIVSSYASRFVEYTNQQFEVVGEVPMKSNRIIIRTMLLTSSKTVDLDYQLVELEGQWKIFDVVANGVSDLSLKRATYSATFKSSGINGVIEEIEQTIHDNIAKTNVDP